MGSRARRFVVGVESLLVAIGLLVAGLPPAIATTNDEAPPQVEAATTAPETVEQGTVEPEIPTGEKSTTDVAAASFAAAAQAQAEATGERVEVLKQRTETQTTYANPDGTMTLEVTAQPTRIRDDNGNWAPVDATLVQQPDGRVTTTATPLAIEFSAGGDGPLSKVADGDQWVELTWGDGDLPAPVLAGATATYANVLPDVDLVLEAGSSGFSQYFVVKTRDAATDPALDQLAFGIEASDGLVVEESDQGVFVKDESGEPVFTVPQPRMWDSSTTTQPAAGLTATTDEPAASAEAIDQGAEAETTELDFGVDGSEITVTPDQDMLTSPDVTFPIVIDPSVTRYDLHWFMAWSNGMTFYDNPTEHARIGYDGWSGQSKVSRVFYEFNLSGIPGRQIVSATFAHKQIHSPNHDCDLPSYGPGMQLWFTDGIRAAEGWPGPTLRTHMSTARRAHGHEDYCANPVHTEWDATWLAEQSATLGWTGATVGLVSADETDREGWRKFDNVDGSYPRLVISYRSYPDTPSRPTMTPVVGTGPADYWTSSATPTLKATLNDPDGDSVRGLFQVYQGNTKVWEGYSAYVADGSTAQVVVPAGELANGKPYTVRVWAQDDDGLTSKAWSDYIIFQVDTIRPSPAPLISSSDYPEEEWAGGVGEAGRFTFDANGVADVASYRYSLNSDSLGQKVNATSLGANAQVTLTPDTFGINTLNVVSVDRVGNVSTVRSYVFKVGGAEPAAAWLMNEGTGTTSADVTGNGHALRLGTGVTWGADWRNPPHPDDSALQFSGSAVAATTPWPVLRGEGASFSATGWVKATDLAAARTAISHDGTYLSAFRLGMSGGKWTVFAPTTDTSGAAEGSVSSTKPAQAGVWTHLAVVYNAGAKTLSLYVNGELEATKTNWTTSHDFSGPMRIGAGQAAGAQTQAWKGGIDDVKIFVAPLDAQSVQRIMNDAHRQPNEFEPVDAPDPQTTGRITGANLTASTPDTPDANVDAPTPVWPAQTTAAIAVAPDPVPLGDAVAIAAPRTSGMTTPAEPVEVELLDRSAALAAGVEGLVMRLTPSAAEPDPTSLAVNVEFDYAEFASAYGGDYGSRLQLVQLAECTNGDPASETCVATPLPSTNDAVAATVSADAPIAATGGLVALAAAPAGTAGDYKASSLAPSSSWTAGGSAGDFTWSYPLRVPPSAGGLDPNLALGYSSGSVDGRITSTNNQPSWLGEGHSLEPGFVERRYSGCADDMGTGANNTKKTGDLCWRTDTVLMSLDGTTTELIKDADSGEWRPVDDDGSKVQRLTGATNGDDDGEHWRVTTTDGTQYYFGVNKRDAADTAPMNSVFTVPVAGNHPNEPCYDTTFGESFCNQAWRWNLDYVVDPNGNTITYTYVQETNRYGQNLNADSVSYVRGGYLQMIEYGERAGSAHTSTAPARVVFDVAERCVPTSSFDCAESKLTSANASRWPDVPFDQICTSTSSCKSQVSPTFFSRKRLVSVRTEVLSGSSYAAVDSWTFGQTFPKPGDGTTAALWLGSITHTGHPGTDISLPKVVFKGATLENRVDGIDNAPPMLKYRITSITNETGGKIVVNYADPQCTPSNVPSTPESNTLRCFPVFWTPEGGSEPERHWFHKYVVESVTSDDITGQGLPQVSTYSYGGDPAWAYDDNELVPSRYRTWGQWRGYGTVTETVGSGELGRTPLKTTTLYMRGMDGDHLPSGSRDVDVTDSTGAKIADHERLAGFVREQLTYSGSTVVSKTINDPWISAATATVGDKNAFITDTAATRTYTALLPDRGWRTAEVTYTYDEFGLVTQTEDRGDTSTAADDLCTRTSYARNATAHIIETVSRVETVSVACTSTPSRPSQVVSDVRTAYDGGAVGAAPSKGNVTRTEELDSWSGGPVYVPTARLEYDGYGRVTSTTDALDRTTTTAYTNVSGGLTQKSTVTNPEGHATTTTLQTYHGNPVSVVDANGGTTTLAYDALGRLLKMWGPDRPTSGGPTTEYAYTVRQNLPSAVATLSLLPSGAYATQYELFDGFGRSRQVQAPSASDREGGRLLVDTIYDSRGLVVENNGPYYNTSAPSTSLFVPNVPVNASNRTSYDGAGRTTLTEFFENNTSRWKTITSYQGDRVNVDPPTGDTPTTEVFDARGRKIELWQYHAGTPTGDYDRTRYGYTPGGSLASVTDAAGNTWEYEYDLRGRQVLQDDPDRGTITTMYDAAGQVSSTTDGAGRTLAFSYDDLGRKTGTFVGSLTGTRLSGWTYDTLKKGLLTSSTRYEGGAAYVSAVTGYDVAGRPLGSAVTIPAREGGLAGTYTSTTAYNPDGSVAATTLPRVADLPAETLYMRYEDTGALDWMYGYNTYAADTIYSPYGEVLRSGRGAFGKASWETSFYEEGTRRLTRQRVDREDVNVPDNDRRYNYDAAGNVTRIADLPAGGTARVECFSYDYLRRLSTAFTASDTACTPDLPPASGSGGVEYSHEYGYDLTGNRTSFTWLKENAFGGSTPTRTTTTYTYPAAGGVRPHGLSSTKSGATTTAFSYDDAGNTLTAGGESYTWNGEGKLATATTTGGTSSFLYTAEGDRLLRRAPGEVTLYLGVHELRLDTASNTVSASRYYTFGGLTTVRDSSGVYDLHTDRQGSTDLALNHTTGATAEHVRDPFGRSLGAPGTAGDLHTDRAFHTGTHDPTGLIQLGARSYDPQFGRFLSPDPIIDPNTPQQLNAYAYANNNPTTYTDPTGLRFTQCDGQCTTNGGFGQTTPSGRHKVQGKKTGVQESIHTITRRRSSRASMFYQHAGSSITADIAGEAYARAVTRRGVDPAKLYQDRYRIAAYNTLLAVGHGVDALNNRLLEQLGLRQSNCASAGSECNVAVVPFMPGASSLRALGPGTVTAPAGTTAITASTRVAPWQGPSLSVVAETDTVMYRIWGGGSGRAGEWLTPIRPDSAAAARSQLALPAENAATFISEVNVPAGTRMQMGLAAEAFGQPGGWVQVQLLERIPLSSFGKGVPLQ